VRPGLARWELTRPRGSWFFVAAIGGGLIFHGVLEALHDAGVIGPH
jgi:hypothetical protein